MKENKLINSKDISVVVQGAITIYTKECLESVRKYLPEAEIILSTWENSFVDNLIYDKVVFSENPHENWDMFIPGNVNGWSKTNNINRQIISTNAGLALATRRYTIKFRTDFILSSSDFINDYFNIIKIADNYSPKWKIFTQRILTVGTGNVNKMGLAFHLADYIALGLTSDIKKLWNIPLIDEDYANFGLNNNIKEYHCFNFKYAAEQKLLLDNIDKLNIDYHKPKNYFDVSKEIKEDSENVLINNFIFYDYVKTGIISKFTDNYCMSDNFSYSFYDFIQMYKKHFKCNVNNFEKLVFIQTKNDNKKFIGWSKKRVSLDKIVKIFYFLGIPLIKKTNNITLCKRKIKILFLFVLKYRYNSNKISKITNNTIKLNINGNYNKVIFNNNRCINNVNITIVGNNNTIFIGENSNEFSNNDIIIYGSGNNLIIKENSHCIRNSLFYFPNFYNNRAIIIGRNSMIMGAKLYCEEHNNYITIGDNLTCSDDVLLQNSDGHVIYNDKKVAINRAKMGISISNNVWLGRKCSILKNSKIPKGSIVAASSVVTRNFEEDNIIVAGNPAKIIKHNTKWTRTMFVSYRDYIGN